MENLINYENEIMDDVAIKDLQAQLQNSDLTIGLFGAFSVGKSSIINSLLNRKNLLPNHTNETTTIPTQIRYGKEELKIVKNQGEIHEPISHNDFLELVAGKISGQIDSIDIEVNEPHWMERINIIDTPGRNTKFARHIDITEKAILHADIAFYVMSWQGLTLEDVIYVKHILRYQPNLYFIVNKIDVIDENQGMTIAQLQDHVNNEVLKMFGKNYPIFMCSAKNEERIDEIIKIIETLKKDITSLKEKKFKQSIKSILITKREEIDSKLSIYYESLKDDYDYSHEKNQLALGYEKSKGQVNEYLVSLRDKIDKSENKIKVELDAIYYQLEARLLELSRKDLSEDKIQSLTENEIITTRNIVSDKVRKELQNIFSDENAIVLSDIKGTNVNIKIPSIDFSDIERRYNAKEKALEAEIINITSRLEYLENNNLDNTESEKEMLDRKLTELEEQLNEEYIPQYIVDQEFDPQKYEKLMSKIGFIGDIALTTALTMGAATIAQAGKAGAKEVGKAGAKKISKESLKKYGKKFGKEFTNQTLKKVAGENIVDAEMSKKIGKNGFVNVLKILDTVTSPVQSIATNIGRSLDNDNIPHEKEDMNYRKNFHTKKFEIEERYRREAEKLKELESKVINNEQLKQELITKRRKIEMKSIEEIEKVRKEMEYQKEIRLKNHLEEQVRLQIEKIIEEEHSNVMNWFKFEIEKTYHSAEKMIPEHINNELVKWENEIDRVEKLKNENSEKITTLIQTCEEQLITINNIIQRYE